MLIIMLENYIINNQLCVFYIRKSINFPLFTDNRHLINLNSKEVVYEIFWKLEKIWYIFFSKKMFNVARGDL